MSWCVGCVDADKEMKRCLVESFKKLDEDFLMEAKRKLVDLSFLNHPVQF